MNTKKKKDAIALIQAAWPYNKFTENEKIELNNRLSHARSYGQCIKIFENFLSELDYTPFIWGKEGYSRLSRN
jgi:hypothetical protein